MKNKDRIRVAVIGTRGFPGVQGGVESHCQELFPRIVSLGCDVTVFGRKGYISDAETSYKGVKIVPGWTPRKKSLEAITHTFLCLLSIALRRSKYDLVHIHAVGPSLLVPLARLLRLNVVATNHGPDYDRQKWGNVAKRMLRLGEGAGARYSPELIVVSRHIQGLIKKKYNRDSTYIPNGVDFPEKLPPDKIISKYGLTPGQYIFAVGRIVPEKGFHDLIEAFQGLSPDLSGDWKLVIAGDADHEDDYSKQLKVKASKDPRVIMTGFIKGDVLRELYSNTGLFVLPSYHEGLPIVLLEAMSYGLPVIASSIPANMELVSEEETFNPGDVAGLAGKMELFIKAPCPLPHREKVTSERLKMLKTVFNWDSIAERTLRVYRKALGLTNVSIHL